MPHMSAPVIEKLGVIYLQHLKVGSTVTFQHQGCFARLSLLLTFFGGFNDFSNAVFINTATQHSTSQAVFARSFIQHYRLHLAFRTGLFYLNFNYLNTRSIWLVVAAKLRTFLCTPNKTLLALPSVAGTLTRGLTHFVRILAHVLAPQSLAL